MNVSKWIKILMVSMGDIIFHTLYYIGLNVYEIDNGIIIPMS